MKLNTKKFKNDYFFVLYDKNDFPICYFENFNELSHVLNYRCSDLVRQFNKFGNSIRIIIGNVFYLLYTFEK